MGCACQDDYRGKGCVSPGTLFAIHGRFRMTSCHPKPRTDTALTPAISFGIYVYSVIHIYSIVL